MNRIYDAPQINVRPFLIVPTAITNQEACMVIGPTELSKNCEELIDQILHRVTPYLCKLVTVAMWYQHQVVVVQFFSSDTKDSRSERKGLKLMYGAAIRPVVFREYSTVCETAFEYLYRYLVDQFKMDNGQEGLNQLVSRFQAKKMGLDDLIDENEYMQLLRRFESRYFSSRVSQKSWVSRILGRLTLSTPFSRINHTQPYFDFADTYSFWRTLDTHLQTYVGPAKVRSKANGV